MKVTVISRQKKAVLVEYIQEGKPARVVVPSDTLHGAQVSRDNLAMGIPYGNLEGLTLDFITAEDFIAALNARGIWTRCELLKNMSTVRTVLNEIVKLNQAQLRKFAKE